MDTPLRLLCVDDEEYVLSSLKRLLMDEEYEVLTAASGPDGLAILKTTAPVQVVLSDYRMPGMNGVDFLGEVRELWPDTVRIILSGYTDAAAMVSAINKGGIYRFIPKPWNETELKVSLLNGFERYTLEQQNQQLSRELKKRNEELLALTMKMKERITDRVGELEAENRKLTNSSALLRFLPLAVVSLSKDGSWVAYCNEKAKQSFGWGTRGDVAMKRSEAFSPAINKEIDAFLANGSGNAVITLPERRIRMEGALIKASLTEKNMVLVFHEDDKPA